MVDYLIDEGKNKIEGLKKTEINEALNSKADKSNTYTKTQADNKFANKEAIEPIVIDNAQTTSLLGSNSITANTNNLSANTIIELTNAPRFIKKNHGITARVKFDSFTSLTIGKGYHKYRGKWIVIDETNITPYKYENSEVAETPISHGLTITDYLQISMFVDDYGLCQISINTTSGTFTTTIDYAYEWNYEPFVFGVQSMTDAKISYSCDDFKCPFWVFGDSYMGFGTSRVAGQLKNLGYMNYCINSIAGAISVDTGTPNKSSYEDLRKMLAIATPKFIIWGDGMNGGDTLNIEFLPTLIELCEEKGIELILYMPPSVPTINHTSLNNYIVSTGKRYVNGNDAVGATSEGVWYTGYLSDDNVHPTELGAKAIALRYLNDAPELLQYGWKYDVKKDLATKLDKNNPIGTGAISFNRKGGSILGDKAVAVGFNNTASGDSAFAEGGQTKATGGYSHAENYSTEASGGQSHAEGRYTIASGLRSHAEGDSTTASGSYSHSQNHGTIANKLSQTVFGEYNVAETGSAGMRGNYVEIVGNGTDDNNRSNARTLDWSGNEVLAGGLTLYGNMKIILNLDGTVTWETTS